MMLLAHQSFTVPNPVPDDGHFKRSLLAQFWRAPKRLRLKLVNALYSTEASVTYARQCLGLIEEKHLRGDVQVCTDFLDHEQTLQELADSDLVVLPYVHSTESSSAAGAFAVASLRPVLCSDLPLFDELSSVVHSFPSGNVIALANKILQLASDPAELNRNRTSQEGFVRKLAWPVVAMDFVNLIDDALKLRRQSHPDA